MNQSSITARIVVNTLLAAGVQEAVLCPGSRNAPMSFALLAAAEAGLIRLHVRIDERSAAFLALGLAMASARPVPVCVTSGTAVANVLPAFIEANYSCVPVVVLSANRDLIYRDSGVGQIIDQDTLFSQYARYEVHTPAQIDPAEMQKIMQESLFAAMNPGYPGPIHVDIAFAEPLVPEENSLQELGVQVDEFFAPELIDQKLIDQSIADYAFRTSDNAVFRKAQIDQPDYSFTLDISRRILIIMGAVSASVLARLDPSVRQLLDILPATAEPMSVKPRYYVHPLAVREISPELVIVIGRPTLHREVSALLQNPQVTVIGVPTPLNYAGLPGEVEGRCTRFSLVNTTDTMAGKTADISWLQACESASLQAQQAVRHTLSHFSDTTGLTVAAVIDQAKHKFKAFFLGASNPIRDLALVADPLGSVAAVFANRGASGIDGSIATAMGIAYIAGSTLAFIGDLTFVHDMGGLLIGDLEEWPESLTIVVPNDRGGGIFSLLEQGDAKYDTPAFGMGAQRIFSTPHSVNVEKVCRAMQIDYFRANATDLLELLLRDFSGVRVIEIPCSRENLRQIHQMMRTVKTNDIFYAD